MLQHLQAGKPVEFFFFRKCTWPQEIQCDFMAAFTPPPNQDFRWLNACRVCTMSLEAFDEFSGTTANIQYGLFL